MSALFADTTLAIGASTASLLVKATLTIALALLATRLARRSRAAERHVLLAAAFAALLVLPIASALMPPVALGVPVASMALASPPDLPAPAAVVTTPVPVSVAIPEDLRPVESLYASASVVAAATWAAGTLLFLLPVLAGIRQARLLRRTALPWLTGQALARRLAADAGIRRRVDVVLHESMPGPATCGILRPAIALPPDAQSWSDQELRRAMIHELEHVRRRDFAVHCFARVVNALYWFHPLVWIAWRRLALEAERACDDAVLRRAVPTAYAEQLVVLAERLSANPGRPLLAMASRDDLATRVRALLDSAQARGRVGVAYVAITVATAIGLVAAMAPLRTAVQAQASSAAVQETAPAFEVVSIRRNTSGSDEQFTQRQPGGRFTARNMPLRPLILFAYQIQPSQLLGGPNWLASDRFDIVAKAEGDPAPAPYWEPDPMRMMVRTLLADRFKLAIRKDVQEMPIFELLPTRRDGLPGPQLRTAATDCVATMAAAREAARTGASPPAPPESGGRVTCGVTVNLGRIRMGGSPLSVFAGTLSPLVQRIVVDRSNMVGNWDLEVTYTPDPIQVPPGAAAPAIDLNSPSLFTALQEQLGLKLEASRGPVEVLVIDSVERPAEN